MSGKALPPEPERPLPGDCCDSGCAVCVMDLYAIALAQWQAEVARLQADEARGQGAQPPAPQGAGLP
jgi:hypothetical protein